MANEIIPDEGLDFFINVMVKGGTAPANTYVGLFTSQTATTTPASTAVLSTSTGVTEAAPGGYARQTVSAASWGTIGAKTIWSQTGRGTTATQVVFPAATSAYAVAINGFLLASASTAGIGLLYSNFDDSTAVPSMAIGDIIKITPTFGMLG